MDNIIFMYIFRIGITIFSLCNILVYAKILPVTIWRLTLLVVTFFTLITIMDMIKNKKYDDENISKDDKQMNIIIVAVWVLTVPMPLLVK